MFRPYFKFKTKRFIRKVKRIPLKSAADSLENIDKTVIKRWRKFKKVRRFAIGWMVLCTFLIISSIGQIFSSKAASQKQVPAEGGVYREAIVGQINNLNPLFALDGANADVANIIFDSLLEYDETGKLVPSLANEITANESADIYTLNLRQDVQWQDGEIFNAEDVAFTIELLQDPQVGSVFYDTWQGVEVEVLDEFTVTFKLPNSFAPFPHLLRQLILPEHALKEVERTSIRSSAFSLDPLGTGPFALREIDADSATLILSRNQNYFKGSPLIRTFEVELFDTPREAQEALVKGLVDGFGKQETVEFESEFNSELIPTKLASGTYLFFNTQDNVLKNEKVRQGLTQLVDKGQIYSDQTLIAPLINNPFLPSQLAIDESEFTQLPKNIEKGNELLDSAGYVRQGGGLRVNGDSVLSLTILSADTLENRLVFDGIQKSWQPHGIDVYGEFVSVADFQSRSVSSKDYQIVLATIQNGLDLDNFVFWHSSQAEQGGLNFSRLKDSSIDTALESGRTRTSRRLRIAKYEAFLERWRQLSPAVALHQSLYDYQQQPRVNGYEHTVLAQPADRFSNVHEWFVRTKSVSQIE